MNATQRRHQLIHAIRDELANAGHHWTSAEQDDMAFVLDRLDRVGSCEDAESLSSDREHREHEFPQADADGFSCAIAPAWLKDAECA